AAASEALAAPAASGASSGCPRATRTADSFVPAIIAGWPSTGAREIDDGRAGSDNDDVNRGIAPEMSPSSLPIRPGSPDAPSRPPSSAAQPGEFPSSSVASLTPDTPGFRRGGVILAAAAAAGAAAISAAAVASASAVTDTAEGPSAPAAVALAAAAAAAPGIAAPGLFGTCPLLKTPLLA
ncbi:unnamed protein product, partial [Ectocarpus sp. 8 AP-2014]